ncbi:MAG: HAMP domain-containing sensor histidine kinase [Planctomycetota bacterium]|jgi:two-component system phosphate regulon sensor histidine kinase PhoR
MATRSRARPGRLFWKLFLGHAALTFLALFVCTVLILHEFDETQDESITRNLFAQATLLSNQIADKFDAMTADELDELAHIAAASAADRVRYTFISADGEILGDSHADRTRMENHADRIEVQQALSNGRGSSIRWSNTSKKHLRYAAVRIGKPDAPKAVIRLAESTPSAPPPTRARQTIKWTAAITGVISAGLFAVVLARFWTLPIRRIASIARRMTKGDLSARAQVYANDEIAILAQSLNEMRDNLRRQLTTIDHQRQTSDALLNQLQEGVIVADANGRIVMANPAARHLIDPEAINPADHTGWVGKPIEQCVPQHNLQQLLLPQQDVPGKAEAEITTENGGHREPEFEEVRVELQSGANTLVLLATASDLMLPQTPEGASGANARLPQRARILALKDISEIARTVQMKTDFAANASHELRTPLSAIRGAVDTLLSLDLASEGESAKRFMEVVDRHSTRLEAMVADLLALSRLESTATRFSPHAANVDDYANEIHNRWKDALARKDLAWSYVNEGESREVFLDLHLMNLALNNLIDNAINFTDAGGSITMTWSFDDDDLTIKVADTGCGIPEQELDRVFERFYQVEQARARGLDAAGTRGTGLGLSIVRHALAAMNGDLRMESQVGVGTTCILLIPNARHLPEEDA